MKTFLVLSGAVLFCAAAAMAQVPPTTEFQLDGNPAQSGGYPNCSYGACDYWNLLNGNGTTGIFTQTPPAAAGHWNARSFINGESSTLAFTMGGSKDPNDVSSWACTSTNTPNKDTLTNGYAAAYTDSNGDLDLKFGADRLSTNGDANIGIWFFQQNVVCNPATGTFQNGLGGPAAHHVLGDLFVISAFTGGGSVPTISIYIWNPACSTGVKNPTPGSIPGSCADSNLQIIYSSTNAPCILSSGARNTGPACAITNSATVGASWPWPTSTSSTPSSIPAQSLFMGGVDLTYLIQTYTTLGTVPCITSFLEETRSSQSTTAQLKDFIGGGFPLCGLAISKGCLAPSINSGGQTYHYPVTGLAKNTGVGTLYNVRVFDKFTTPAGSLTTLTVTNNTSNSTNLGTSTLGPGETGTWGDSLDSAQGSVSDKAYAQAALNSFTVPNGNCAPDAPSTCVQQASTVSSSGSLAPPSGTTGGSSSGGLATATCNGSVSTSLSVTKVCGIPATDTSPAIPGVTLSASGGVISLAVNVSGQVCNNGSSQVTGISLTDFPASGVQSSPISVGTLAPNTCAPYSTSYGPNNIDQVVSGIGGPSTGPGRYFWTDTIKITGATASIGSLSTASTCGSGTIYGCASISCPICQGTGECTTQ